MRSILISLVGLVTLAASPALAADAATLEANKKTVLAFYEAGLNQKDFDAASKFFGPAMSSIIQPRPTASRASRHSSDFCVRNFRSLTARSSVSSPTGIT